MKNKNKLIIVICCIVVFCLLIHLFGGHIIDFIKEMHGL